MKIDRDVEITVAIRDRMHHRALSLIARGIGPSLGRYCLTLLGSREEAEDAAQDALIEALGAMPAFRGEASVRTWLFAIARRVCARRLERRRRRGELLAAVAPVESDPPATPLDEAARGELLVRLRRALVGLSPEERDVLALRYGADLDYEEAAAVCGISPEAARKRASRAFATMRQRLGNLPAP